MTKVWLAVAAILENVDVTPQSLYRLELVFVASLGSRHQSIVNSAISLWNRTFGTLESVEYSTALARSLRRVGAWTDICAPGLTSMEDFEASF